MDKNCHKNKMMKLQQKVKLPFFDLPNINQNVKVEPSKTWKSNFTILSVFIWTQLFCQRTLFCPGNFETQRTFESITFQASMKAFIIFSRVPGNFTIIPRLQTNFSTLWCEILWRRSFATNSNWCKILIVEAVGVFADI